MNLDIQGFRSTARLIFQIFVISKKVPKCIMTEYYIFIGRGQSALHHGLSKSKLAKVGTVGDESRKPEA